MAGPNVGTLKKYPGRIKEVAGMANLERKGGLARKLMALAAGALAAKLAMMAVEQIWTRGLKQDLPEFTEEESMGKKVAWIGLTAAAVGMAREVVRQVTAPKVAEHAADY